MKLFRRICIALVGGTVLLIGIVMIVLPGPAILIIPAGLAILALEFAWARHYLHKIRQYMPQNKNKKPPESSTSPQPAAKKRKALTRKSTSSILDLKTKSGANGARTPF